MSTKQKRAIFITGVTAAVYAGIRYLLPLILPFFISYGLARLIWPFVRFAKQKIKLPETAGIVCGLTAVFVGLIFFIWWFGSMAGQQFMELAEALPQYVEQGENLLLGAADKVSAHLGIGEKEAAEEIRSQIQNASARIQETLLPKLVSALIPTAVKVGDLFAAIMVAVAASVFFIKERSVIKEWMQKSVYRREIRVISRRLGSLGRAFFKTQGVIFLLVTLICTLGLWVLKNRYFLLFGIGLGILDMLPVFGTGTVLVPCAVAAAFLGNWKMAGGLTGIYFLTWGIREFLEAHMMGRQLGISSLEMMIAMYAGLKLFGIWGLFLGPIGWILIKEIDKTLYIG